MLPAREVARAVALATALLGGHVWGMEPYSSWTDAAGASCCSNLDCAPVEDRLTGRGYEFLMDGRWWPVDPSKVLRRESPDGGAHACVPQWPHGATPAERLKCFVPGLAV